MKTMLLFIFLTVSTHSLCQRVTYKSLVGTSWKLSDSARALTMTFKFIDSSYLSQKSWAPRYQPLMATVIKYSLDTTKNPTLLNVEGKGELSCTSCTVKIEDNFLTIQNSSNNDVNNPQSKIDSLRCKLVFKKVEANHELTN